MLLLLCGITGLLCAYDLFTTFFFLELVSGCCVMLVIDTRDKAASSAAFKYAIMLAISSFFYLLGLSVVYNLTGTTNVLRILDTPALITILNEHSRSFMFAVACFLITFFVKIGLIPFHGWLPDVYVTANPVVICSFSAKSIALFYSFYSLIQPFSILHQFTTIIALIVMFGMISMFFGVLIAFAQKDFMRMLAYCQIYLSGLAACTLFLANPTSPEPGMNFLSGMYYIVNGALMKTGMILILHPAYLSNHTRNMEFLGGFIEKKRILAICYVICIFSLAGIPPTSGFFAKWLVYNTLYATMVPVGGQAAGIAMLIFLACMATVEIVVLLRSFHRIFLGKPHRKMMDVHVYAGMWGPPVVLTAIAIILGFQPSLLLAMLGAG
jgi:formate hydrogenlyase subunit 3/multisubunit Na+/H+ antiporter MnhD subunit